MGTIRRFFPLEQDNDPFIFWIDTTKINPSGTDGSENNLTFRLPIRTASGANNLSKFIVKVSDGRADIDISSVSDITTKGLITFTNPGIYQIKIYGYVQSFGFEFRPPTAGMYGQDFLKIIYIDAWGKKKVFERRAFNQCSNLIIRAVDTLVLPPVTSYFFRLIKGFESSLSLINTSRVTDATQILSSISNTLPNTLNPFWLSLSNFNAIYNSNIFSVLTDRIEIISDTVTALNTPAGGVTFLNPGTIRFISKTPNLITMYRVFYTGEVKTRCHGGEIDVRNVINTSQWLSGTFTTVQVDATILGWAELPFMQSGVTWNWNGSKYSNNPAVIAAYNKITITWGVIFTNLTMA